MMNIRRKLAAVAVAAMTGLGVVVGVAPAAQASQITITGFDMATGGAVPIRVNVQEPTKVYTMQGPSLARWTYCDYATEYVGLLNLYKYQGYCGVNWSFSVPAGACVPFTGQPWSNNSGSASNQAVRGVILSDSTGCGGTSAALQYITSHPNFVSISGVNLYHKVSSFYGAA